LATNNSLTGGEENHPMEFLLNQDFDLPQVGQTRTGWVIAHRNNEVLVDIGAKSEGVIKSDEFQSLDNEAQAKLDVGNEILVYIVSMEDAQGNMVVSYKLAAAQRDWKAMDKVQAANDICQGTISGFNKGGLLVQVKNLQGFVPKSQFSRERQAAISQSSLQKSIGDEIHVKVLEVDAERNRLILSEKEAESEVRQSQRTDLLKKINIGDIFDGRVINLAKFGAFVDIGGIEGLVHLSEISWKRINNPGDLLSVGDEVKVEVLTIDQDRERLALSLKRTQPDPWTIVEESYEDGQLMEATVTKLAPYGAFARIHDDYELEGLIHISEISEDHIEHPSDVLKVSQVVTVRIIRIDPEQRQLGLSIKQVASPKFAESDLAYMGQ